jgi:hypothetical protein
MKCVSELLVQRLAERPADHVVGHEPPHALRVHRRELERHPHALARHLPFGEEHRRRQGAHERLVHPRRQPLVDDDVRKGVSL